MISNRRFFYNIDKGLMFESIFLQYEKNQVEKTHKLFITSSDYRRFLKVAAGSSSNGIIQFIDHMVYGLYHSEK